MSRRERIYLSTFAALAVFAIAWGVVAATIERTVPAGTKVMIGSEVVAVVTTTQPVNLTLKAAIPDPPDVTFKPPPGMKIKRLTSGTLLAPIKLEPNTCYLSSQFESGGRTKLTSAGTLVTAPNKLTNVLVKGIDFVCTSSTVDCLRVVADGAYGVEFDDCTFTGGKNNVMWQGVHIDKGCTTTDLTLYQCRFIDPLGKDEATGQNLFVANVDGLNVVQCFGVNAGFKRPFRDIYTHFLYAVAGCKRVSVLDCFIANPQAVGIQVRGPVKRGEKDDGKDASPWIVGNVIYNAPICIMPTAPRATVTGNTGFVGPHQHGQNTLGKVMLYPSVGRLDSRDNRVVSSGLKDTGYVFKEGPYKDNTARGDTWAFQSPEYSYVANLRNTADLSKQVNLDDLVLKLRAGGDIKAAVVEARRRAA